MSDASRQPYSPEFGRSWASDKRPMGGGLCALHGGYLGFSCPSCSTAVQPSLPPRKATTLPGTRKCPLCDGKGVNPVLLTHVCPKCHGEKRVAA